MSASPDDAKNLSFSQDLSLSALFGIEGFSYGSVTEDFNTTMSLHAAGWKTAYYWSAQVCACYTRFGACWRRAGRQAHSW